MKKEKNYARYLAALAGLTTFILYLPVLRNEFVEWDDFAYVVENVHIRSIDMSFFKWAFTDFYVSYLHPLTWISHAVDYAVWGLNPLGHHLTNIVLHALNVSVVVFLIIQILEAAKENTPRGDKMPLLTERTILLIAGVTGLFFGLHPAHVESVAWVSERKDLLCALFYLLSVTAYVKYSRSQKPGVGSQMSEARGKKVPNRQSARYYLLVLGFFALALMSKPMAVTLPVVLLILDWYPLNRISSVQSVRKEVVEKLPLLALSLIAAMLSILAQKTIGAMMPMNAVAASVRLAVAAKSLIAYLGKMILPVGLIPFYPYPRDASIVSFEYLVPTVLVLGITIACAVLAKKQRVWLAAWGYYVVTLVPVLGIVQVGSQSMANRYTYLPSLGPFLLIGLVAALFRSAAKQANRGKAILLGAGAALGVLVIACLAYLTFQQIGIWKNSMTLWTSVLEKETNAAAAYNGLGVALEKTGPFDKAIENFDKAVALEPSCPEYYFNRATAYEKLGRWDRAIEDYDRAIALNPSYSEAYANRGMVYEKTGQINKARTDYLTAIDVNASSDHAYFNLGVLYSKAGLLQEALDLFTRALDANPGYAEAYGNRGIIFSLLGNHDRALRDFNAAIRLDGTNAAVYFNRAGLYREIGEKELAAADYRKACASGYEDGCRALRQETGRLNPE